MQGRIDHLVCKAFGTPPWAPPGPLPPSELPDESEIVIVGAGVTGLSAAISAAQAGREVTVVERRFGGGATMRSGGIVLGDTLVGPRPGFEDCDLVLRDWILRSGADCNLSWKGCFELARDPSLPRTPVDWDDSGPVRLAERVRGGVVDPAKLQSELARIAQRAGATIVDGVAVLGLERLDRGISVETDRGSVSADHVVMAVDASAWRPSFDPWPDRVVTVALKTEPLSRSVLAAIGIGPDVAFYTRDLPLLWGRVMPDQSLLVGRETLPLAVETSENEMRDRLRTAGERLTARARRLHPALGDIGVERVWGGPIARAVAGVPAVVPDPFVKNVSWVGGYGGHGLAQAFRMGRAAVNTTEAALRRD